MAAEPVYEALLCQQARSRHMNAMLWQNLWNALLLIVGITLVVLVVVAAVLLAEGEQTAGLITGGAALADFAPIAFVVKQRGSLKKEADAAWRDVEKHCASKAEARESMQNLGFSHEA